MTMQFNPSNYYIQTCDVKVGGESFVKASIAELPHLATYETTAQEAIDVLLEDIQALYESATRLEHPFPTPSNVI